MEGVELKSRLYKPCKLWLEERLSVVKEAMNAASEAGNDETKSSAGDKHETGRAMAQLEQEKNSKQWEELMLLKKQLEQINYSVTKRSVGPGSLVVSNKGSYFISIGAGKLTVEDKTFYAISTVSPLAKALYGHKKNEKIDFAGQVQQIVDVF